MNLGMCNLCVPWAKSPEHTKKNYKSPSFETTSYTKNIPGEWAEGELIMLS